MSDKKDSKQPNTRSKRLAAVRVAARLELQVPNGAALAAFLLRNLNEDGISVKVRRPLDEGRTIDLRISDSLGDPLLDARARVLGTEQEGDATPRMFLKFTELTTDAKRMLHRLLEKNPDDTELDPRTFDRIPEPPDWPSEPTLTDVQLPKLDDTNLPAAKDEKAKDAPEFPEPPEESGADLGDLLEAASKGDAPLEAPPSPAGDQGPPTIAPAVGRTARSSEPEKLEMPPPPAFEKTLPATDLILGIDLGTTFSCGCIVGEDGKPDIVLSEGGYRVIPSVVTVTETGVIVGWAALDKLATHPRQTVYGSKRLLGRRYESPAVQDALHYFDYDIVPDMGYGTQASEAAVRIGEKIYPLEWVSMRILHELLVWARDHTQKMIRKAIISVPAYYNDHQRQAVMKAGELAGMEVLQIVNEPTAASVAYGIDRGLQQTILVYDLGGGTFDVSLLELNGNIFEVLATGGDPYLGGVDFDNRIVDWVLERFREDQGIDLTSDAVVKLRVRQAAEAAKKELSEKSEARIFLPYVAQVEGEGVNLDYTIDRETFNHLVADLVDRTLEICKETLEDLGKDAGSLDEVLLVGGQTRTPLVQGKVHSFSGRTPRKGVHPDEAVAVGAALLGHSRDKIDSVTLLDVVSVPIGVALPGGRFKPVIDKNTSLPARRSFKIATGRENQKSMAVDVYQGTDKWIENNEYLGTAAILDLPPAAKGAIQVEFSFRMDPQGFLTVTVSDSLRGLQQSTEMLTLDTPESLREMMDKPPIPVEVDVEDFEEIKKKGLLSRLLKR